MKKPEFHPPTLIDDTIENLSLRLIETTNQLSIANKKLICLDKERNEMLANISHDLRAPITAIRSAVDLFLSSPNLSIKEIHSLFRLIDQRTLALESLINDLYYLFSLEDNSMSLQFETIKASHFFEEYFYSAVVDNCYSKRNMVLNLSEDLKCCIRIDIQKMIRALDNLFTNAAKYTNEGDTITFSVSPDLDRPSLSVIVTDTGIGIPKENLPHIFNRTYTVSAARTPHSQSGSGLGLSIVNAIIKKHGGYVFCESEEGKGSCFTISLPIISYYQ